MSTYLNHQGIRVSNDDVTYSCNICPETFKRLGHFHDHVAAGCAIPVLPKTR